MKTIGALAIVLALGLSAQAQTGAEIKACWGDALRFCKHALPNGIPAVKECLIGNSRVSKNCRNVLKAHGA
ncbi:MAG: hypothetical protein ACLQNV_05510 [Steroidobacteraceae bacterium]